MGLLSRVALHWSPSKVVDAKLGKSLIGRLVVSDANGIPPHAFGVAVEPPYRRQGIARAMYQLAEESLGKHLVPSSAQTDDGFNFWMKYRPDAIDPRDLRRFKDQLMGMRVPTPYGDGNVYSMGQRALMARLDNGNNAPARRDFVESLIDEILRNQK